ncbi:gypsy retrotransposon integrase-like protein 1 isoform X1 [Ictalurus furcatus]|uniref:gypsy retrotransposon integrase-like protein 1 isoform X1 n=1 Tax=Ictalurus furcatus TaxID=66913 RepID=UPI00234FDA68|nr:gypsy retrotransposon integrase-like protein 1 isoform X1 [Ictalurus furcatus]
MLSVDSLQVAEEEVVESSSSRLGDIYTLVAEGCYPHAMNPIRKKNLKRYAQKFIIDDGRLYYVGMKKEEKREVVIDAERKRRIFLECHFNELGHHLGQKKTVHRIQSKYYWLGIVKDVVDWIKVCETCQHAERNKNMARTPRPLKVDGPWDTVTVEIMGPFPCTTHGGNTRLVIITDYYSKWVEAFPVQKRDVLCVARCISSTVYRYGSVKTIHCSQNADFCGEVSKQLSERWSLQLKVQYNALLERSNTLLKDTIKQVVAEKQADWDDFIDPVLALFRTSVNPATKFTPYCLMFNRKPSMPGECPALSTFQMKLDLLSYEHDAGNYSPGEEPDNSFLSSIQEQRNQLNQMVFSNMNAAYKQEKKSAKRRGRDVSSITLTVTEPLCPSDDSPSPKRLKDDLFLTFPVETVISAVQVVAEEGKDALEYVLPGPDVH